MTRQPPPGMNETIAAEVEGRIPAPGSQVMGDFRRGYLAGLDDAARVVEKHDYTGREWSPKSFWAAVTREATARIRALAAEGPEDV